MNWKGILAILSILIFASAAEASFTHQPIGARAVGMGSAFVAISGDPSAIAYNAAGVAFGKGLQTMVFYSRPFGLKELETTFAALSFSRENWTFGAAVQQFGFAKYREQMSRFVVAYQFGKKFAFGGSLFYGYLKIPGYGEDGCLGLDLGSLFKLSPRWSFGTSILNATLTSLRRSREALPQELNAGFQFLAFPTLRFVFQISQESGFQPSLRSGVEWTLAKKLALRSGYLTEPGRFTFGCGIYLGHFRLNYAWASHLLLGGTHQVSVEIRF